MRQPDVVDTVSVNEEIAVLPGGYLTRPDAARYLGVTTASLCAWAQAGKGPTCHRIGGGKLNIYLLTELEACRAAREARRAAKRVA